MFGQLSTAMVTPFDHKGNIDFTKTTQLIEYLLANGTESIVVNGTTGESPTLTTEEKIALIRHVVKVVNKRVPVIAGTGSNNTYASIELTKKAEQEGVDAVMLVVPYYNKPSQAGMKAHFTAISEATTLPVMLYNIPGRSGVNMLPETIVELAKLPNVKAVKEASADLNAMTKIIAETGDDFYLYSGDDNLTLPILAIGGAGVVSVASHVLGNEMSAMIADFTAGRLKEAAVAHGQLVPKMQALFMAPNPVPVKTALQLNGLDVGSVRLPLVPLTEQERQTLQAILQQ